MKKRTSLIICAILAFAVGPVYAAEDPCTPPNFPLPTFPNRTYNVKNFGATGGGTVNDTAAINRAIDKCNSDGGGNVTFPAGRYAAASIHLKSNVRLQLASEAVLFGLKDAFEPPEPNPFDQYQDFGHSHFHNSLMYGENVENVSIVGGKINGGGAITTGDAGPGNGDKLISIRGGKNLNFDGITHEKGAHFCYLLNDCDNVTISRILIKQSRDGVDLMGCKNVQISNCRFIGCGDDTIGVKIDYALGKRLDCANIYVWNSYFESGCNGIEFGTETAGNFTNCNFWNIGIGKAVKSGLGISNADGAVIDGVNYRNIDIKNATCPIFIIAGDRLRTGNPDKKVGIVKNVHFQDITISNSPKKGTDIQTSVISGWPTSLFENITLENVKITYAGGEKDANADLVPPTPTLWWPKNFGPRPASGFYVRNGKGLTFKNVDIRFEKPDARTPLVVENVDGLTLDKFKTEKSTGGHTLQLTNVKGFTVTDCADLDDRPAVAVEKHRE